MKEQEAKQKRIWEHVADKWRVGADEVETWFKPITIAINSALGDTGGLLADLGCGAGSLSHPPAWRVVGLDIAEDMIAAHGCAVLGSFHPLPFRDGAFDALVSRFGLIFAADVPTALEQSIRAIKPGGHLVFSTWGPPERNLWVGPPTKLAIEMLGLNLPQPNDPGAFRLSNADEVRDLLARAGYVDVSAVEIAVPYYSDLPTEQAFDQVVSLAGPLSTLYARMGEANRVAFRSQVLDGFASAELTGQAFVWSAAKPG